MSGSDRQPEAPPTRGRTIRWWARFYDLASWAMLLGRGPAIREKTLEVARLAPGQHLLDVGCGTGTLALAAWRRLQPEGKVFGIDASPEMIEMARQKAEKRAMRVSFQLSAIEDLPFPDASFDVVLSSFMLHHLPEDVRRQGFAQVLRVLKPGGRFLAVDLADSTSSLIGRLTRVFGHAMPRGYVEGLVSEIRAAGFENVREVESSFHYLAFLEANRPDRIDYAERAA